MVSYDWFAFRAFSLSVYHDADLRFHDESDKPRIVIRSENLVVMHTGGVLEAARRRSVPVCCMNKNIGCRAECSGEPIIGTLGACRFHFG